MTDTRSHRAIRNRLVARQRGLCHYCRQPMTEADGVSPRSATLDHIVPRAVGGRDRPGNFVACCWECNQAKADSCAPFVVTRPKRRRRRAKKPAVDAAIRTAREARKTAARRSLGVNLERKP